MTDKGHERAMTAAEIREQILAYAAGPENRLQPGAEEPAWEEPLVGFSRGDDPLYGQLKAAIGSFYWTPVEIFRATFPERPTQSEQLTVVSWILPQTRATREENRQAQVVPSDRWVLSRQHGEAFNARLRDHLVAWLGAAGYEAVAPQNSPLWRQLPSERYGLASCWSERHAAHVSGLGTFGLCDGLITAKGKAVRCGSVVARLSVPPTVRPYAGHHAYCLFFRDGSCGRCMTRCPVGAITPQGHDKERCARFLREVTAPSSQARFGFSVTSCGFCQVGVPCEASLPGPQQGQ